MIYNNFNPELTLNIVQLLIDLKYPIKLVKPVDQEFIKLDSACNQNKKNIKVNALSIACERRDYAMLTLLLAHANANEVNQLDHQGKSPISYAIENDDLDAVKLLIAHGADLKQKEGAEKLTPLLYALKQKHVSRSLIECLYNHHSQLIVTDKDNHGVLWYATYNHHTEILKWLLDKLQSMDIHLSEMYTVLYWAQRNNKDDLDQIVKPYALATLGDDQALLNELEHFEDMVAKPKKIKRKIGNKHICLTYHAIERIDGKRNVPREGMCDLLQASDLDLNLTDTICIVEGTIAGKKLRIITAQTNDAVIIITAYWPNNPELN